jgi:5-bromo-4-chloroindolyl phosphate hydrolysis protein
MSRYHRRVRDDLVDVVFDALRSAVPQDGPMDEAALRAQAEREAARAAAKAERRRREEERSVRSIAGVGAGLLAGGVTSLMLPTVAAVGVGLLAGGAAHLLVKQFQAGMPALRGLMPRRAPPRPVIAPPEVDGRELARSQRELIQGVLDDAAGHMRKLDNVARELDRRDASAAELCRRLVRTTDRLSDTIAEAPSKFPVAQRLFIYHLPKAVYVAETLAALPEQTPAKRAEEARHVLTRLDMFFEKTLLDMSEVDAAEMDLEMRLINQSLDEDLRGKA